MPFVALECFSTPLSNIGDCTMIWGRNVLRRQFLCAAWWRRTGKMRLHCWGSEAGLPRDNLLVSCFNELLILPTNEEISPVMRVTPRERAGLICCFGAWIFNQDASSLIRRCPFYLWVFALQHVWKVQPLTWAPHHETEHRTCFSCSRRLNECWIIKGY